MKTIQVFLVAVIGITGLFAGCSTSDEATPVSANSTQVDQTLAKAKGPSAGGQGGLIINGQLQHFSFHASVGANGVTTGSYESRSPGQEARTHGSIKCLTIFPDGKTAFIGAQITQRSGPGFPGAFLVGNYVFFSVQDNGEGATALTDQFSDYYDSGATLFCGPYVLPMQTIKNGNIQVKP